MQDGVDTLAQLFSLMIGNEVDLEGAPMWSISVCLLRVTRIEGDGCDADLACHTDSRRFVLSVTTNERPEVGPMTTTPRILLTGVILELTLATAIIHLTLGGTLFLLNAAGYETADLTDNEMAKLHVRHMVGGHAPEVAGSNSSSWRWASSSTSVTFIASAGG